MAYQIGDIVDAPAGRLRFKGGNVKDKANWEPVQERAAPVAPPEGSFDQRQAALADKLRSERPARQAEVAKASFQELSRPERFLAGAGKTLASLAPGLASPDDFAAYNAATQGAGIEDVGELGAEVGLTAIPLSKLAQMSKLAKIAGPGKRLLATGAAGGSLSAGLHAEQAISEGREFSPVGTAAEIGLSALGGGQVGRTPGQLQKLGRDVVRAELKPGLAFNEHFMVNPPDYQWATKNKFIGIGDDAAASLKKVEDALEERLDLRDVASDGLSVTKDGNTRYGININGAIATAAKKALSELEDQKGNVNPALFDEVEASLNKYRAEALRYPTGVTKNGWMTLNRATSFRRAVDKDASFKIKNQTATRGDDYAARLLRDAVEDQIATKFPEVREITQEMGKLIPLKDVLIRTEQRERNKYPMGLLGTVLGAGAAGSLAGGAAGGTFGALAGYGALAGVNKIQHSIGAGAALERLGQFAQPMATQPGPLRSGAGQAARFTLADMLKKPTSQKKDK